MNTKWNNIVNLFTSNNSKPEQTIQILWEKIFSEFFGYSTLLGDIDSQRAIAIGSSQRIIPDIIIKNSNKDLFIVELKQPQLQSGNEQLLSYLKLLKIEIGVLICNKLFLYYFDYNKPDNEQLFVEISFTENNPDGIKFLELFQKTNFNKDTIKEFIINKKQSEQNIINIKNQITIELIKDLLKKHFIHSFTSDEITQALNSKPITITTQNILEVTPNILPELKDFELQTSNHNKKKLSKKEISKLFRDKGVIIPLKHTMASKNVKNNIYWANPDINLLNSDWHFILNNKEERILYHFYIPAKSIQFSEIKTRKDRPQEMDLYIQSKNFIDKKSNFDFSKFLKDTLYY